MIADWYHYAILELVTLDSFQPSPKWIAKKLGISLHQASAAIERLQRLEYLETDEQGRWINCSGNNTTVGNDFTAVAFRKLQRQVLEMAVVALEEVPLEDRDQSSMTLAIDSSRLPEIKEELRSFRRHLTEKYQRPGPRDSVYHLGLSFYPVTRKPVQSKSEKEK